MPPRELLVVDRQVDVSPADHDVARDLERLPRRRASGDHQRRHRRSDPNLRCRVGQRTPGGAFRRGDPVARDLGAEPEHHRGGERDGEDGHDRGDRDVPTAVMVQPQEVDREEHDRHHERRDEVPPHRLVLRPPEDPEESEPVRQDLDERRDHQRTRGDRPEVVRNVEARDRDVTDEHVQRQAQSQRDQQDTLEVLAGHRGAQRDQVEELFRDLADAAERGAVAGERREIARGLDDLERRVADLEALAEPEQRRRRDPQAVDDRSRLRAEILEQQPIAGQGRDPRVLVGDRAIVLECRRTARRSPQHDGTVVDRDHGARRSAGNHAQRHHARRGRAHRRFDGRRDRLVDHAHRRRADADRVAGTDQGRRRNPHAVDVRPVVRPQVFDQQSAVGEHVDLRMTLRELGLVAELAVPVLGAADDERRSRERDARAARGARDDFEHERRHRWRDIEHRSVLQAHARPDRRADKSTASAVNPRVHSSSLMQCCPMGSDITPRRKMGMRAFRHRLDRRGVVGKESYSGWLTHTKRRRTRRCPAPG